MWFVNLKNNWYFHSGTLMSIGYLWYLLSSLTWISVFLCLLGSLPVCWSGQCWMASFPELGWVGNFAECPSSGCHGAPAMGRVWGGRNRWGSAPLLVQCPEGSPGLWTKAGPQLCGRGTQCLKTDSSKCSQLLHTQLGQHETLTLTHDRTKVYTHEKTCLTMTSLWRYTFGLFFSFFFASDTQVFYMTSPSSGDERICHFMCLHPQGNTIVLEYNTGWFGQIWSWMMPFSGHNEILFNI